MTHLHDPYSSNKDPLTAVPSMTTVSVRSIAIGCILIPVMTLWLAQSEMVWCFSHSTAISLFAHVTFALLFLALINLPIKRYWPHRALTGVELMTIYMMLSIASVLCSLDLMQVMIPSIAHPVYGENAVNNWKMLIIDRVADWAIVRDRSAVEGMAIGNSTLYDMNIFYAWLKPVLFWGFFLICMMVSLLCINIFLRYHWTERERLSFPVIQIPMMISTGLDALLRNKLFWLGFALAGSLDLLNGISFLHPIIPPIPNIDAFRFSDYFTERPWNAISAVVISIFPFVIGLVYFIPTDLAFSCWFFYVIFKLELVITSSLGIYDIPGFPFPNEQAGGGYIALGLLALWASRRHLAGVIRTILGRPGGVDDRHEAMSYRTTLIVFLICFGALLFISCKFLGATLWVMLIFFAIFYLYSLAIARMRAEMGPPAHDLHAMGPDVVLMNAFGSQHLSKNDMATFSQYFWFNRAYRSHFSAHDMEGFKFAQLMKVSSRSIMVAMLVALIVGIIASFWALLHMLYVQGYAGRVAGDAFSVEAWNRMAAWVQSPQRPKVEATFALGFGSMVTLLLGFLRMKYTWWLWHPVGYATSTSWSMEKLWFCLFLGWMVKLLITRYGGAVLYRKAMPFFVGLVLGEFVVGGLWTIYGSFANIPVYRFWG